MLACIFGQRRSAIYSIEIPELSSVKHTSKNHYFHFILFTMFCSFSPSPPSAESPTAILDSTHQSGGHARRKRQPHLCGCGLANAIRQVDDGLSRADQGRRNANGPQRAGSDQHTGICQLHVHGHVISGRDRGNRSGHCKRWEFVCALSLTVKWINFEAVAEKIFISALSPPHVLLINY